ncbi:uncharacterized protein Z519_10838 [Cladophialophora bantiana CBS 173.52]|uniref:Uncharacterized protein n=1 Tax=Cladophialophora bantiana (strain ATCC 10958 / CBS 173.52 / CDC B-1940 / NIH 8579) TaxID=1442370 RepID=A0A0D2EFD1_CLAB1|nr:uncharacterized protein Z519_10838 [Cladophialophora bantiana CBS 173.52]KIW88791.1 hypothetical protein Z519_10838 [Cladophialophora bantiana CBS 173.52]
MFSSIARVLAGNQTTSWIYEGNGDSHFPGPLETTRSDSTSSDVAEHMISFLKVPDILEGVSASLAHLMLQQLGEKVTGHPGRQVLYVEIRWVWLVLPLMVETVGIILLFLTAWVTREKKTPLWKELSLALLFHGLDERISNKDVPGRLQAV